MPHPGHEYQAILYLSFGGPERAEDVMPFLEHVTRGRNVPSTRLEEVAEHYYRLGGKSPINDQNREIIRALEVELAANEIPLPVYFGNRNWHPFLTDTLRRMMEDGIERALAFVTSAFSSYSGCRQYLEDIEGARREIGAEAPVVDKIRVFYNHPDFVAANAETLAAAVRRLPPGSPFHVAFTAHSIPLDMARNSSYGSQLNATAALVAAQAHVDDFAVAYQSRSGPPQVKWLEPDILDHLKAKAEAGTTEFIVHPLGFVSDHMEVLYDLDIEAQGIARRLGVQLVRAATAASSRLFIRMMRRLIQERVDGLPPEAVGDFGPHLHQCAPDCCRIG